MGKNIDKNISKNLSSKFWQKHLDYAKQSAEDDLKTASKKAIQKTTEAAVDLIGNKSARILRKSLKKLPQNTSKTVESETKILREKYTSPERRQKIIEKPRLI